MKVLLIRPPSTIIGGELNLYEPLGLEYIAAAISGDNDVRILDMRIEKDLKAVLEDFNPHVAGITGDTSNVNTALKLFSFIKGWNPEIYTVAGGHHATVSHHDFLGPHIDLIVMGNAVFEFREVLRRLERKENLKGISGLACSENGKSVFTPCKMYNDLDVFPFPNRELTEKYREHYFSWWMKPLTSIRASMGCPYRCNFCVLWKLTGGKYIRRKNKMILEELQGIKENNIFFVDDEALIDSAKMLELAGLIKSAGINKRYYLYGRSDSIVKNPGVIEAWREIGLERMFLGLEFFRDEDMKSEKKGTTIKTNEEAIRILNDLDIYVCANFIVKQDFSRDDFRMMREYCSNLDLFRLIFSVYTPLPGTDVYDELKDKMISSNPDYFDFIHTILPTKLPVKEFYRELHGLFRKTTSIKKSFSLLGKYPLRDIPSNTIKAIKSLAQIKNTYKDYME